MTSKFDAVTSQASSGMAAWSRAYMQMAQGLMSAGTAQVDLARSMLGSSPGEAQRALQPGASQEKSEHYLHTARTKFEATTKSYRHINDELAATFFSALGTLVGALPEVTKDGKVELPAAHTIQAIEEQSASQAVKKQAYGT